MMKPLEGLLVLDFSLFLAGPLCALRLADLGARVIKVERPDGGDLCRSLYISPTDIAGDSTLFHAINRNKESFAANLKDAGQLGQVKSLIAQADVMITNFRPGVMKRLGLDYPSVSKINPRLVYGAITGYGNDGPWVDKPGQDLLAQALSGLMWLSGDADENDTPVPMGLSAADMFAGHFLAQGILACLVRRGVTGSGGLVETSLLEALLDFQFEVLTTYLNDGRRPPRRSAVGNANAYLAAPYGVYRTADGWLALAMIPLSTLGPLIGLPDLSGVSRQESFARRDEIKRRIADALRQKPTAHWLAVFEPVDVWCAPVLDWPTLVEHEAFKALGWTSPMRHTSGRLMTACRGPIRIDGQPTVEPRPAPRIGEHQQSIARDYGLSEGAPERD